MKLVSSFDVFDAVLIRRVGAPEAVSEVLARRLAQVSAIPVDPAVFAAARLRRERELNRELGRHATLREVHVDIARAFSIPPAEGERWAAAEEDLERELTVAVPGVADRLAAARSRSDRVVFVSDTPHSSTFVRELLEQHGLVHADDVVFTSAETGVSKSKGGLFRHVSQGLGGAAQVSHTGDNRRSDVWAARAEGWSAQWAPQGRLNRYEEALESHARATDGLTSWLAGSSRIARLEAEAAGVPRPVAEVAAGALAPMLVGYALWVTAQARRLGVQRLYYVARDGEVMLTAARHVIGALSPELELRYLHGSRQAWVFAATAADDEVLRAWLNVKPGVTPSALLRRVGLTPEEAYELTGLAVTAADRADTPLSAEERVGLAEAIRCDPLLPLIRQRAEAAAERTTDYLRQEGLLDGVPSALVDVGWSGRAAAALDQLVRRQGGSAPHHLVVGLSGTPADTKRRRSTSMHPWLFDKPRQPRLLRGFGAVNVLVEMWCAGTEGRTMDYERRDGRMVPVLTSSRNQEVLDWGLAPMQAVAVRTAELVAPQLRPAHANIDLTQAVWDNMRAFWVSPTDAEVRAWGDFPWEEEVWPPYLPIAQRISSADVLARLMRGDRQLRRSYTWPAGTARRSSAPWRAVLRLRAWQEENAERVRRLPRRLRLLAARGGLLR